MKSKKCIGPIVVLFLYAGCGSKMSGEKALVVADSVKIQVESADSAAANTVDVPHDSIDCIRGQAEPVMKATVYPNAVFKLDPNHHSATETAILKSGERLVIKNWGCEYYVLTFRFETARFHADTTDIPYWFNRAILLMKEVENGLDAPLDIQGGTRAMENFIRANKVYTLMEEIVYDDDVIRDFVTLDRIQRIDGNKFAIEVSYGTGPL